METVFHALRTEIEAALKLEELLEKTKKKSGFQEKHRAVLEQIGDLRNKIGRNTSYRSALFESFSDHTLTEQEYVSMKQEYDRKAEAYREELGRLEQEEKLYSQTITPQNRWITALKKSRKEETVTRELAVELIDRIIVTGYNTVEIVWNFRDEFAMLEGKAVGI